MNLRPTEPTNVPVCVIQEHPVWIEPRFLHQLCQFLLVKGASLGVVPKRSPIDGQKGFDVAICEWAERQGIPIGQVGHDRQRYRHLRKRPHQGHSAPFERGVKTPPSTPRCVRNIPRDHRNGLGHHTILELVEPHRTRNDGFKRGAPATICGLVKLDHAESDDLIPLHDDHRLVRIPERELLCLAQRWVSIKEVLLIEERLNGD